MSNDEDEEKRAAESAQRIREKKKKKGTALDSILDDTETTQKLIDSPVEVNVTSKKLDPIQMIINSRADVHRK